MREADEGRAKAIALKAIEDFRTSTNFLVKKISTTTKVIEDFQASTSFEDEKANFVVTAYKEAIKNTKDKVMACYPEIDSSFLDELLDLVKDSTIVHTPMSGGIFVVAP